MARKNLYADAGRRRPDEHMVTSAEGRSLHRGRRRAPRTRVCRACVLWLEDDPYSRVQGVLLDLNPYGMRLRSLTPLPVGTRMLLQMMRDDSFRDPLSPPIGVKILRSDDSGDGFYDHGLQRVIERLRPNMMARMEMPSTPRPARAPFNRMHTADLDLDRSGKRRG